MNSLVCLDYIDLDLKPSLESRDDKLRFARASFLTVSKALALSKSLYLLEINEKLVIIDTANMKTNCTCMDFASRRQKQNRYCKHIYRAVRWLIESKDQALKVTSNQFFFERFKNPEFLC